MSQLKNILFSTTRQWNPGDEFILMGVLNLFAETDLQFNPIIFNRNPEIQHEDATLIEMRSQGIIPRIKRVKAGTFDNSFKSSLMDKEFVDMVVFAGSPEWASPRMRNLYRYIDKHSIPTYYLGIGLGADFDLNALDDVYKNVLSKTKLITVRDPSAKEKLSEFNPTFLPCPALLSATKSDEKKIDEVQKIGLIYGSDQSVRNNRLESATYAYMKNLYTRICEVYKNQVQIEFISHYIDELAMFKQDFPDAVCHYSYDSQDYLKIYQSFDCVIGPRVHGIGISASMGIPGVNLAHDMRGETCRGFKAEMISVDTSIDDAMKSIESCIANVSQLNQKLLTYKADVFSQYKKLLQ